MSKHKVDSLIASIIDVKQKAAETIDMRPATYKALDVAQDIAGWELAYQGKEQQKLIAKIRQIYLSAANKFGF